MRYSPAGADPVTPELGPNNAWTISIWWKPDIVASNDWILDMGGSNLTWNRVQLYSQSSTTLRIDVNDSGGTLRKRYQKAAAITDQTWQLTSVTWDGTNLTAYRNGVDLVMNKNQDAACTQDNDLVRLSIGATLVHAANGKILAFHSVALWDEALTAAELVACYNAGDGSSFDLQSDSGNYASSANLVRWWRLGSDPADLGREYVAGDNSLSTHAVNIDATDVVADAPT
jgi:hypothetical protein